MGVLDGVRDFKPGIARHPLGAPSLVAGLLKRDDGILRRVLRSIGRVEPPLQLQNLGGQLATVRLLLQNQLRDGTDGSQQECQQGPTHAEAEATPPSSRLLLLQ